MPCYSGHSKTFTDKHHQRIINVIDTKITNAILEGFNSKIQTLKRKARGYKDFDTLISEELQLPPEERIQVCSILTPNFLHFPMAKKLLESGFHVICEKPMTNTYEEAKILYDLQQKIIISPLFPM